MARAVFACALVAAGLFTALVRGEWSNGEYWPVPAYCASPGELRKNDVIPLSSEQLTLGPVLQQVQIIHRHGARVPYARLQCWNAKPNPMNEVWDCPEESLLSSNIERNGKKADQPAHPKGYLYKKTYDLGLNELQGSCNIGQLLPEGLEQLQMLGSMFQRTYVGNGPLHLFNTSLSMAEYEARIHLRSDDIPRVVASGQALFDAFLPRDVLEDNETMWTPVWHTADLHTDVLLSHPEACPLLSQLQSMALDSPSFKSELAQSPRVLELEREMHEALGWFSWDDMGECIYVSRCTGRALPAKMTPSLMTRALNYVDARNKQTYTYRSSSWSKIAMGQLMYEVKIKMDLLLAGQSKEQFLLISGHDSTVMPILGILLGENWDGKWAPYASYLAFELYELTRAPGPFKKFAVRTLYQGKPLHIPGCAQELCDYDEFQELLAFAKPNLDCTMHGDTDAESASAWGLFQQEGDSGKTLLLVMLGFFLAAVALTAFFYSKRKPQGAEEYVPIEEANARQEVFANYQSFGDE